MSNLRLLQTRTHIVAVEAERVTGTIGVMLQPGRIGLVFPPELDRASSEVPERLIQAAVQRLSQSGAAFLELILAPEEAATAEPFVRCGFQLLTDAILLEKRLQRTAAPAEGPSTLQAIPVDPVRDADRLTSLIERINTGSLDCPELDRLRTPRDLLEAHSSHADEGRARWWRYEHAGKDVGIVLGVTAEDAGAWEILFFGAVSGQRGKAFGQMMLAHFHAQAAAETPIVRAGVDSRNHFASALYAGIGYAETGRLRVWIHPAGKTA